MVHYIYGASGSGKTRALMQYLSSDVRGGKRAFFIVPEQEAVSVERNIAKTLPARAQLDVEVLNFSRLCNRIFRTWGGLSYNTADAPAKSLIMWKTIRELSPMLEEYRSGDVADFSLTKKMISAAEELKAYCITPEKLDMAAERVGSESPIYKKLRDISLICSAYEARLSESYTDERDDISRALAILEKENPFAGVNVYLDSFAGFTKQEMLMIARISQICDEMYITLPIPSPKDASIHLESLRQTVYKLKKLLGADYDETYLTENARTESCELRYLQENLWNFNAPSYGGEAGGAIRVFSCETPYSEADTVAGEICRTVRDGARYGEIAIILRNSDKYRGILDVALQKHGIPYFMSEKTDLLTKPLARFLFSALKIKLGNFRAKELIAHLKSGFCDIDPYDVDIFEDYVNTWNINGNKFFEGAWTMNPDGYTARLSSRGERIISVANSVKDKAIPPLALYFSHLDASESVKEMCRATLEFLKSSDITSKVRSSCKKHLEAGNKKAADEDMKLYALTLNILYQLSAIFGEEQFTLEEFSAALDLMFSESTIGTIPTSSDEITVGSASMLRASKIKYAFIMGLNEGEFPAAIKEVGIFTDSDKAILESLDVSLSADTEVRMSEELFFALRAISAPSHGLVLTNSALSSDGSSQRRSIVLERVNRLFPDVVVCKESSVSAEERIWTAENLRELYPSLRSTKNSDKIRDLIIENDPVGGENYICSLEIPLSARECKVSAEAIRSVFGNRLSLTQSRLEKYVMCGFDYYCSYVLGLRESKRAVFQLNDIGTFIHYILEMFVKEISEGGVLRLTLSDSEIDEILSRTVKNYLFEVLGEDYAISSRTKHLFLRLHKLSFMIAKSLIGEFGESDFFPEYFELPVGMGEGGISALEFELKDGSTVSLRGIADRVDTYKKDGNVYIRIVDYKTGSKEFSFEELKHGLNTQLLIYLFSICYAQDDKTKRSMGCAEGGQILPAGIQYLSSNAPTVSIEKLCEGDEIEKLIQNEFSRSGLLSDDPEILRAINHSLDPKIVSKVKENDDGTLIGKSLVGTAGFEEIYALLSETIVSVAQSMKDGKADAIPLKKGENAPCRYCKMKSVCRASVCKSKI